MMSNTTMLPPHANVRSGTKYAQPPTYIEPQAVRVEDAARALAIGRSKTWELIRDGHLKAVKIGGRTVIKTDELKRFVADLE